MLKKANRLAKAKDIAQAFARGRTFFNPFFTIKFFSGGSKKLLTVVVSTKVFKSAVKRNRLKRIIREQLRLKLDKFKNGSYIIIAKPKISRLPEKEVLQQFSEVCSRLR